MVIDCSGCHWWPQYMLAWIAHQFPQLTTPLQRRCNWEGSVLTEDSLAALPAGCWPAATVVGEGWRLAPRAAAQLPRVCPNLWEVHLPW